VYFGAINDAANGKTESSDWQSEDDRHHHRDQHKAFGSEETFMAGKSGGSGCFYYLFLPALLSA